MAPFLGYLALGAVAGVAAGFFGIGGGIILIPALIWLFHLSQHEAQGMTLAALVLPVGLLGAWTYYRVHPFPLRPALWIALGLFLGTYLGGSIAQGQSDRTLRIAFGVLMVIMGAKLIAGR